MYQPTIYTLSVRICSLHITSSTSLKVCWALESLTKGRRMNTVALGFGMIRCVVHISNSNLPLTGTALDGDVIGSMRVFGQVWELAGQQIVCWTL